MPIRIPSGHQMGNHWSLLGLKENRPEEVTGGPQQRPNLRIGCKWHKRASRLGPRCTGSLVMELMIKSLVTAFLLAGLLVACGTDFTTRTQEDQVEIDPGLVLKQAMTQLLALESASFTLDHLKGSTVLMPGVSMTKVSGEVSIPDRFNVTVEAQSKSLKSYLEIGMVTIEDTAYMTGIFGGGWNQISPDSLPFNLLRLSLIHI